MSADTAFLALYLDAPLQSWGYQSRFDRRTTLSYPTRSGILGLICAAMGKYRADKAALAELDALSVTVLVFRQGGRIMDFHTVGGGYDRKTQKQFIVHTAKDKLRDPGKETVPTHREYLEESRFGAIVGGNKRLIEEVADAVRNPTWGIWLGRKACIPASPVCAGVWSTEVEAETALAKTDATLKPGSQGVRRRIRETATFDDGTDTLMDRPIDFGKRDFAPRRVAVTME
jgi:CRISPR system Cascade subunit CasD